MSAEPLRAPRNKSRFTFTQAPTQREKETARTKDWTGHCTAFHAPFIVGFEHSKVGDNTVRLFAEPPEEEKEKDERFG